MIFSATTRCSVLAIVKLRTEIITLSLINTIIMFMKIINSAGLRCRLTRSIPAAVVWNVRHYNYFHSLCVNNYHTTAVSPILANNIVIKSKKSNINSRSSMMMRYSSSYTITKVDESVDDDDDDVNLRYEGY
jgi:hypothetical protein